MIEFKSFSTLILLIALSFTSYGQTKTSKEQFSKYYHELRLLKVDSILIIKSGCTGCEIQYADTLKNIIDGQTIYILAQRSGQFKLAVFDDIHNPKYFTTDTCDIFKFINQNKVSLIQKEKFYKSKISKIKSKAGLYAAGPVHYSYEELSIKFANFNYDLMIIDDNKDQFGLTLDKEKWFILTNHIIKSVYDFILKQHPKT